MIHRIRKYSATLARLNAGLFFVVWMATVIAPCAMAMQQGNGQDNHDCPHCPPPPCHELEPEQCDEPDPLELPRFAENVKSFGPPSIVPAWTTTASTVAYPPTARARPPVRAGPRVHLLHAQFDE